MRRSCLICQRASSTTSGRVIYNHLPVGPDEDSAVSGTINVTCGHTALNEGLAIPLSDIVWLRDDLSCGPLVVSHSSVFVSVKSVPWRFAGLLFQSQPEFLAVTVH